MDKFIQFIQVIAVILVLFLVVSRYDDKLSESNSNVDRLEEETSILENQIYELKEQLSEAEDNIYTEREESERQGYNRGFDDGVESGYESGTSEGYLDGYNEGYSLGYEDGYSLGRSDGFSEGYDEAEYDASSKKPEASKTIINYSFSSDIERDFVNSLQNGSYTTSDGALFEKQPDGLFKITKNGSVLGYYKQNSVQEKPVQAQQKEPESKYSEDEIYWVATPGSDCFSSIGYAIGQLFVVFRDSGKMYVYFDVSEDTWEAFRVASSIGSYFNNYIRDQYEYELIS